jgi:flavin-dependent dehydrogenase
MADDYEVIIVGGGLGGAALGTPQATAWVRVLILEREQAFRDRVRGEYVRPWGVTEARTLCLYELLKQSCGCEARFRVSRIVGLPPALPRDLVATSPHHVVSLHFYRPEMQVVVLRDAVQAWCHSAARQHGG